MLIGQENRSAIFSRIVTHRSILRKGLQILSKKWGMVRNRKSNCPSQVENHLSELEGHIADGTLAVRRRRLIQFGKIFTELKNQSKISTENPKALTVKDIDYFIGYRKKSVEASTILDDLAFLDQYLSSLGNNVIGKYRSEKHYHVPKKRHNRLPPLNDAAYTRILEKADAIETENWTMMSSYAIVLFCMCGGLRAKEIRMADADKLTINEKEAKIFLIHVKGEDSYGGPREAPIIPEAIPFLKRYMEARRMRLDACGKKERALIPPISKRGGYLSYNSINKLKSRVEEDVGFNFDLRMCRRTYGQTLVDRGVSLEEVQIAMGHANPNTTYKNYCGKRPERVVSDIQAILYQQQEAS